MFSIEIAIAFLEICSKRVSEVFKMYLNNIFDKIHSLLDDEQLDEEVNKYFFRNFFFFIVPDYTHLFLLLKILKYYFFF